MSGVFPEGQIFAGRYRLVRCIASGGMGAVYEVVHLETDRRRALKVMHAAFAESDEFRTRFKREARVAAQVDSEFIVDVFDAGVDEATKMPFLVMELLARRGACRTPQAPGPASRETKSSRSCIRPRSRSTRPTRVDRAPRSQAREHFPL